MNCTSIRERLALLVYGDLPQDESEAVERHLRDCLDCQAARASFEQTRLALELTPPPEVSLDPGSIVDRAERKARARWRWRRIGVFSSLAISLLALAILKLEVQIGERAMLVRWGAPAASRPNIDGSQKSLASLDERVQMLQDLTAVLAADVNDRDRASKSEVNRLAERVDSLVRITAGRLSTAERDVNALYAAHFKPSSEGAIP